MSIELNRARDVAKLVLLGIVLFGLVVPLTGCSKNPYETQVPTPFMVYKAVAGASRLSHYMLPGHSEVDPVVDLLQSFVAIDLTQSSDNLDWEPLRPLVSSQFNLSNRFYAERFEAAELETRVQLLNIKNVVYNVAVALPGIPLNSAIASAEVAIRYLDATPSWLETSGVTLNQDYMFPLELRLVKEDDKWVVRSVNYSPRHPVYGPLS